MYKIDCRSPETKFRNVDYLALDGERSLFTTFLSAAESIQASLEKVREFKTYYTFLEEI